MGIRNILLIIVAIFYMVNSSYAQNDKNFNVAEINLSSEIFDYQQKTIHHDNFHREVTRSEKWKIGENYGSKVTYYSPRKDYATVDDGFRIKTIISETGDENYPHKVIAGYLTNDQQVSIDKSFRFITNNSLLRDNFFIEISVPSEGRYAVFVCNYEDDNRYDAFEITTQENQVKIELKRVGNGAETTVDLLSNLKLAKSVKIGYLNGSVKLYCDNREVSNEINDVLKGVLKTFIIKKNRPIGIMVSKNRIYEYRVFDVYTVDSLRHIDVCDAVADNGIHSGMHAAYFENYSYRFSSTLTVAGLGAKLPNVKSQYPVNSLFINTEDGVIYKSDGYKWIETNKGIADYAMYYNFEDKHIYLYDNGKIKRQSKDKLSAFPAYVQRFEIRAADATNTEKSHCEIAENNDFSINNYNLRRRKVEFSTFLPVSFLEDDNKEGGETLIQFQISTDAGKIRQPLFTIASNVKRGNVVRYHLNRRYIPTRPVPKKAKWKEEIIGDNDVDLGKAKLGVWDHWEIYVKEGYMDEHCPLLIVKRNGKEVYRSTAPNTYNIMSGSYIRYGVYKSIYKYDDSPDRKRIVYISNFRCDI